MTLVGQHVQQGNVAHFIVQVLTDDRSRHVEDQEWNVDIIGVV